MGGGFAVAAKIGRGADDAFAEVALPEAIDDDAGGEGILVRRDPFGEGEAAAVAAAGEGDFGGFVFEGEAGLHLFAFGIEVATGEDEGIGHFGGGGRSNVFDSVGEGLMAAGEFLRALHFVAGIEVGLDGLAPFGLFGEREILIEEEEILRVEFAEELFGFRVIGTHLVHGHVLLLEGFAEAVEFQLGGFGFVLMEPLLTLHFLGVFGRVEGEGQISDGGAGEEGLQAVVVAVFDGIVLVIVALGATGGEAEEDAADGAGDVVQEVLAELLFGVGVGLPGGEAEEALGDEAIGWGGSLFAAVFVAGDVFLDEEIVRLVGIEGANDVVAIAPGGGAFAVNGKAVGFGIANEIEPMAAPAFAVAGVGEEFIDLLFVGEGIGIVEEGPGFFGGGREADEAEVETTEECAAAGFGGRCEVLFFEFGEDEIVDGVPGPLLVCDGWGGCFCGELAEPGPVVIGGGGVDGEFGDFGFDFGDDSGGELGAEGHARRHFAGEVGDDAIARGAVFAAFLEGFDGIETEAALSLGAGMAGAAVFAEQGQEAGVGGGEGRAEEKEPELRCKLHGRHRQEIESCDIMTRVMRTLVLLTVSLQAQPSVAVVEKIAGKVGFYSASGERTSDVKVGTYPHEIVRSRDGKQLYVTDNGILWMQYAGKGGNTISIIDVATRTKAGVIDLGEYRRPHGMAVHPVTGQIVVTIENPDGLLLVDPVERKVVRKFDVQGKSPHMVLFGPGGKRAYVSNTNSGTVASIEIATGKTKLIPTGKYPQGGVLAPDGKTIYVTNAESNKIVLISTATDKVIGEIATSTYPNRVTITPDGKTLVYSLGQAGKAAGFADTATRKETGTVGLEGEPLSLTLSKDGKYAFSGVQAQGKIHVIDVGERKIIRTIVTPKDAGPDPALPLE